MATTLADLPPHILQTNILPRLDGPSLSSTAATSSYLQNLCTDDNLWSHICKSTWPSITDPRLDDVISTFPAGYRSFFQDSFPALITDADNLNLDLSSHPCPSKLISAVDIHYQKDIVYSRVELTDTTDEFLSSALRITLNEDPTGSKPGHGILKFIGLKVDELEGTGEGTLSHLKESLSLSWILVDPTRKRAGNISSVKPVSISQRWMSNEISLLYVTVLPGCNPNEMVQCRIHVILCMDDVGVGFQVKEVMLELLDLEFCRLKGRDFLVITQGAILEENSVRRKMVDEEEIRRRYRDYKNTSINSITILQSEIKSDMVKPSHFILQKLYQLFKVKFLMKICEFL